jgi:murein hydrolase activator
MRFRRQAALAGAALVWAGAMTASAAPQTEAAKLERQQAAEQRKAKALAAKAAAATTEAAALSENLAGITDDRAAAAAARLRTETELEDVLSQAEADARAYTRDRDALEALLIGLIGDDAAGPAIPISMAGRPGPEALSRSLAGLFSHTLASHAADKQNRIAEAQALSELIASKRQSLLFKEAALEQAGARTQAQLAETASRRDAYQAQAESAAARSRELARQARDLRDLAARAAASQKKSKAPVLAVAPGGRRTAPAAGAVLTHFGAATRSGAAAQGVTLRTAPGAKVVAPAEATVTYAGPFRSFGQVLILDQGNGYAMILTGLDSAFAGPGDKVAVGALIGQMGQAQTGASTGGALNAPELYFEVRQAGRPVDPERWLSGAK